MDDVGQVYFADSDFLRGCPDTQTRDRGYYFSLCLGGRGWLRGMSLGLVDHGVFRVAPPALSGVQIGHSSLMKKKDR